MIEDTPSASPRPDAHLATCGAYSWQENCRLFCALSQQLPRRVGLALGLLLALLGPGPATAARQRLDLRLFEIALPGAPAAIVSADVDRDGLGDLVVAVAYTEWDQLTVEESVSMDQVEGLIEMMTVVPSLADRRELRVFLGLAEGGYRELGEPLELETSVITVVAGPPGEPVIALTDEGVAGLRLVEGAAHFEPLFSSPSVLQDSGALLPDLGVVADLDGDGVTDLSIPREEGLQVHLGGSSGISPVASDTIALPPRAELSVGRGSRYYPLPLVADVDGDRLPDVVFRHPRLDWGRFWLARGLGAGRFAPLVAPLGEERSSPDAAVPEADRHVVGEVVHFGDLDGDGRAEYVTAEDLSDKDAGWRKEIREAKRPPARYRVYAADEQLRPAQEPAASFLTVGYAFATDEDDEVRLPGGFQDLDGDGRRDLVAITLDFSMFQALRVLAVRSISIGLDFHVWCQGVDGSFRGVRELDLSGKFKLRLDDLRVGQMSQFAGDFDGDGRSDFVQMGRGRRVTIHRGQDGCRYPLEPDLTLRLREEPRNLALVQVRDFDGDELADLLVVQPQAATGDGATAAVRLDLYQSGGRR